MERVDSVRKFQYCADRRNKHGSNARYYWMYSDPAELYRSTDAEVVCGNHWKWQKMRRTRISGFGWNFVFPKKRGGGLGECPGC